jgi:peroxiredoxin
VRSLLFTAIALLAALPLFAAEERLGVGKQAPDFALRAVAGPNVRLSEQRGDVVVIAFWSSRCNPCRAHLAELDQVYSGLRAQGLMVFAVNVDDDVRAAREYASQLRVQYPVLLDPSKQVARAYRVDALPMMFTIDRAGVVRGIRRDDKRGAPRLADAELRRLLAE